MRLRLTMAVLASIAAAWLACSSFADAPASETPDASTPEGATPTDATSDAIADASAPCTAFFCDGFERTTGVDNLWNGILPPSSAELSLSPLHPKSGSSSLQMKLLLDAGPTGDRAVALVKELPVTATLTVLDFWLYYPSRPATDTTIASIPLRTLDGNVYVLLETDGVFQMAEQYISDGGGGLVTGPHVNVGVVNDGQPRHLTVEVGTMVVANGPGARLTVDGDSKVLPLANADPRPEKIHLGSTYSAQGLERKEELFFYDDVVIEATPR